jgi:hypothetical protein
MKNPDNKPLRIVHPQKTYISQEAYVLMLSNLAIAESNLVKAGKDSALNHFIAIMKELEKECGFKFEVMEEKYCIICKAPADSTDGAFCPSHLTEFKEHMKGVESDEKYMAHIEEVKRKWRERGNEEKSED